MIFNPRKIVRIQGLVWALGILLSIAWVWTSRFSPDDAFITFRYSKHLAEGLGPVYNVGEPVEGYTNFLWMLLMALPHALGIDVVTFAAILGYLCHLAAVFLVGRMAKQDFQNPLLAILLTFLLLLQPTILAFSSSGMETSFNLMLWMATISAYKTLHEHPQQDRKYALVLGLLMGLCLLSRPDSIVLAVVLALYDLLSRRTALQSYLVALLGFLALVLPFLIWKWSFYGAIVPNTFISKSGGAHWQNGLAYLLLFGLWTCLPFVPLLHLAKVLRPNKGRDFSWNGLWLWLSLSWIGYVLFIGGDFMEFRMMAPAIPGMMWLAFQYADEAQFKIGLRHLPWMMVALLQLGFWLGFGKWGPRGFIQPVAQLHYETANPKSGLIAQGKTLSVLASLKPEVIMATGGAGAQPYYHGLPTIDMIGLNDARVAREGLLTNGIPGHARFATYAYLVERQVNIVVGGWPIPPDSMPPDVISWQDKGVQASFGNFKPSETHLQPALLLIPVVDSDWRMVTYYLHPHPGIDSLIVSNDWKLHPIQ